VLLLLLLRRVVVRGDRLPRPGIVLGTGRRLLV
jgi:hypothetical protein